MYGFNNEGFRSAYEAFCSEEIKPMNLAIKTIFRRWQSLEFWAERTKKEKIIPMPVQRSYGRIKRAESVLDKLQKRTSSIGKEEFLSLFDILGFRLVVYVESQLAMIDRAIRSGEDFEMHPSRKPKWYYPPSLLDRLGLAPDDFDVENRKESGYASIHYFLRPREYDGAGWFELQVRTMLFDAWGEIEHKIIYKPHIHPEYNTNRHLQIMADQLMALDSHFDVIYQRMTYLQNSRQPEPDDLINEETLPWVCASWELPIAQPAVTKLCSILADCNIGTVGELTQTVTRDGLK